MSWSLQLSIQKLHGKLAAWAHSAVGLGNLGQSLHVQRNFPRLLEISALGWRFAAIFFNKAPAHDVISCIQPFWISFHQSRLRWYLQHCNLHTPAMSPSHRTLYRHRAEEGSLVAVGAKIYTLIVNTQLEVSSSKTHPNYYKETEKMKFRKYDLVDDSHTFSSWLEMANFQNSKVHLRAYRKMIIDTRYNLWK